MTAQTEGAAPLSHTVADNIAAEAGRRRYTQAKLAVALGMSREAVSARYNGRTPWSLDEMERAARLFGMRPGDLLPRLDSNQQPSGYRTRRHLEPVA